MEGFEFQVLEFYGQRGVTEHFKQDSNTFGSVFQELTLRIVRRETGAETQLKQRDQLRD